MRNKGILSSIDRSNLSDYPNGRIKDNLTPVNELLYGDIHEMKDELMRLYGIVHNNLADNQTNGYQFVEALIALATKNDYSTLISQNNGVLNIPVKLGLIKESETFTGYASVDFNSSTFSQIRGSLDNTTKNVAIIGDVKINDYVLIVNRANDVLIVQNVSAINLDFINNQIGYLKAANAAQVINGVLGNVSVTPESFLAAYADYTVGNNSSNFLANESRNGLYPKEHFEIVSGLSGASERYGFLGPVDVDFTSPVGTSYPVGGQISSAVITDNTDDGEEYLITFSPPMDNNNYEVNLSVESLGRIRDDNDIHPLVWKKISTSQIAIFIQEENNQSDVQSIRIHFTIKQR